MNIFHHLFCVDINRGIREYQADENAVLVDVRSREEYDRKHGTKEGYVKPDLPGPEPVAFPLTAEELDECGVEVCYRYYKSPERELGHVFHCNMCLAEASQCNADECAFFWAHV